MNELQSRPTLQLPLKNAVTTSQISLLALILVGDIGLLLIAVSILLYALIQR